MLRPLNEDMERGATGGEGGTGTLGITVVVTVAVGSGPLVPTIGTDDRGGAGDAARALARAVPIDEDPRDGDTAADRTVGSIGGAGDNTAINTATTTNPTTSAATLYKTRLATDMVRRAGAT